STTTTKKASAQPGVVGAGVRVAVERLRVGVRFGFDLVGRAVDQLGDRALDVLDLVGGEHAALDQRALEGRNRIVGTAPGDFVARAIGTVVVVGRVREKPVAL